MEVASIIRDDSDVLVSDAEFGKRWMELVEYKMKEMQIEDCIALVLTTLVCIVPFALVYFFGSNAKYHGEVTFAICLSVLVAVGSVIGVVGRTCRSCYIQSCAPLTIHGKKLTQGVDHLRALHKLGLYTGTSTEELYNRMRNF